jgi:hypothetical protein
MEDDGPIVLRLEVSSGGEPVTGVVCAPDGGTHQFIGWSELFAVLAKVVLPGQVPRRARGGR